MIFPRVVVVARKDSVRHDSQLTQPFINVFWLQTKLLTHTQTHTHIGSETRTLVSLLVSVDR